MAATGTPTPNIGLRIPLGTDPASVDDINYNSNLIDTKLGAVGNDSVQDQIDDLNSKISQHSLGECSSISAVNSAIITAISSASPDVPYFIQFTPTFNDTNFSWAVYKGYIYKGAGALTMAAVVLSSGAEFVYGLYNNNSIEWRNVTKRNAIQSQTITATTTAGGGISLGSFTNYSSSVHTPLYAFVTTNDADRYCVLTSTSSTKANWVAVKNANGSVVSSTSVTVTLVWKNTES